MSYEPNSTSNDLSNLAAQTAVSEDLDPQTSGAENLGKPSKPWGNAYIAQMRDTFNNIAADWNNRVLGAADGSTSIDFSATSRILLYRSVTFDSPGTRNVGSASAPANAFWGGSLQLYDNFGDQIGYVAFTNPNSIGLAATFPGIFPSFAAGLLNLSTANSNQMPTGSINVKTGAGTGKASGDLNLGTGNSDTQQPGNINLQPGACTGTPNSSGGLFVFDGNGNQALAITPLLRQIFDASNTLAADFMLRLMNDLGGALSTDFDQRILYWSDGITPAVEWDNGFLGDNGGTNSIDWNGRQFLNAAGATIVDYSASVFSASYPYLNNTNAGNRSPSPQIGTHAGSGVSAFAQRGGICSDNGGFIQCGTGTGASPGELVRVPFFVMSGLGCACTISPGDAFTANAMTANKIYVTTNTNYFSINMGVAGNNGDVFQFQYTCIGMN